MGTHDHGAHGHDHSHPNDTSVGRLGVASGVNVGFAVVPALVLHATWRLARNAIDELLDRAPASVTPDAMRVVLADLGGVTDIHHVHSRPLGGGQVGVTAHVVVDGARSLHDAQATIDEVSARLASRLGVAHTTLQLECHDCDDPEH